MTHEKWVAELHRRVRDALRIIEGIGDDEDRENLLQLVSDFEELSLRSEPTVPLASLDQNRITEREAFRIVRDPRR